MKANILADFERLYQRAKHHVELHSMVDAKGVQSDQSQLEREIKIYQTALTLLLEELHIHKNDSHTKNYLLEVSQTIAHVGGVELDVATHQLRWSAETYRIHDTTPEEFDPNLHNNLEYYTPESRPLIAAALTAATEEYKAFDLEVEKYTLKGRKIFLRTTCVPVHEDGKVAKFIGIFQDITERKQAELAQQHQNRILGMITDKTSLDILFDAMVRDIEKMRPNIRCTILLLDKYGQHLYHVAAPSMPEAFIKTIDGETIGLGRGSCGTAAFTGEPVIVEDINTHPWWESYRELALEAGFEACWSQPILAFDGKVLGTFAIYHHQPCSPAAADLQLIETEARLAALAIEKNKNREKLELAASVFTHAREGIMITDAHANIVDVNETFSVITGYSREEALHKNPRFLQSNRHTTDFYKQLWNELRSKGFWSGELWNTRKNGEVFAQMQTISCVNDNTGKLTHYVSLFTDITPIKMHQQQLEYIAHYDALTRLPNRLLFDDRLKQAIAHSHRTNSALAVFYIDLDGFKTINDNYGHDVGDQLLVTIASRWNEILRECDTLARIGGDEFIVILIDIESINNYTIILERLLSVAKEPIVLNKQELKVSASIGVVIYPQDGIDADQLLRHADQAMYSAKQAGKNCFHLFDKNKNH